MFFDGILNFYGFELEIDAEEYEGQEGDGEKQEVQLLPISEVPFDFCPR